MNCLFGARRRLPCLRGSLIGGFKTDVSPAFDCQRSYG